MTNLTLYLHVYRSAISIALFKVQTVLRFIRLVVVGIYILMTRIYGFRLLITSRPLVLYYILVMLQRSVRVGELPLAFGGI